ncbi:MAG: type II toxin-antitoxin system VapC family toxin [Verrucomicrobia bacterium]|nr:type II toxin-antitoxin system VapC family toxin [Verrucomicrobiota bacterium]
MVHEPAARHARTHLGDHGYLQVESDSAVSLWEIAIKHALGKLDLKGVAPADLVTYATDEVGFNLLDLNSRLAAEYGHVPALHPDPFDRMLIHQAVSGGFSLVSADRKFKEYKSYGLKLVW